MVTPGCVGVWAFRVFGLMSTLFFWAGGFLGLKVSASSSGALPLPLQYPLPFAKQDGDFPVLLRPHKVPEAAAVS